MVWVATTPGPTATNELFQPAACPRWMHGRPTPTAPAVWRWPSPGPTCSSRRCWLASSSASAMRWCNMRSSAGAYCRARRCAVTGARRGCWQRVTASSSGAALAAGWRPVYSLLLTALLMTLFFSLLGWRTFAAQTAFVRRLQPFVVSTHLVEELITPSDAAGRAAAAQDANATFAALCSEVLQTDYAALMATGASGATGRTPLAFSSPCTRTGHTAAALSSSTKRSARTSG